MSGKSLSANYNAVVARVLFSFTTHARFIAASIAHSVSNTHSMGAFCSWFVIIFVCSGCLVRIAHCSYLFAVLSDRVTELNTALGRTGLRLESVETTSRQLGE
jgi:hypothetical protein